MPEKQHVERLSEGTILTATILTVTGLGKPAIMQGESLLPKLYKVIFKRLMVPSREFILEGNWE